MSTGLHSARGELGLPTVSSAASPTFLSADAANNNGANGNNQNQPKPFALSPRTFNNMEDLYQPLGSFRTGLTPRVFSTGLTPRSGLTPRYSTGFTPRLGAPQQTSTNDAYFGQKMQSTGYTPKDNKMPTMRYSHDQNGMNQMKPEQPFQQHAMSPEQMQQQEIAGMNAMGMYEYLNRANSMQQAMQQPAPMQPPQRSDQRPTVTPTSNEKANEPEDLDERRRMKNRERVRKCRKRKQDRLNFLEERTTELEKENNSLRTKMARTSSGKVERTEEEKQAMKERHVNVLHAYVNCLNNAQEMDSQAKDIWSNQVQVTSGASSIQGVEELVSSHKQATTSVFSYLQISHQTIEWKNSEDRCVFKYQVNAHLRPDAEKQVKLTEKMAVLAGKTESMTFTVHAHVTFHEHKIVDEVRLVDLTDVTKQVLATHPDMAGEIVHELLGL